MTSTQHTGVVVSAKEADAWHAEIKKIMAERHLNYGDAVNLYIKRRVHLPRDWGGGLAESADD